MGAAGAQTRRSLGHRLLHPILRLLLLCAPTDFEAQSPQIQIPNACPVTSDVFGAIINELSVSEKN